LIKIALIIDWIDMNPHHLELFYHVAKSKGVSRAARQMSYGIQQPSVSVQVNALEKDLGVVLYERRPFKLTPAGEELFRFVQPFFGKMAEVRERLEGAAQLRFGASPILFRDYLPPVIQAVRKQFPRLSLILRALNQPDLIEAMEHDDLDLIISLIPERLNSSFCSVEIIQLPLILLVPARSKVKSAEEFWRAEAIAEPLISLGPRELICQKFQQTLAKLGVYWKTKIEMDSLELIEKYVEAGYGVGLSVRLPEHKLPARIRLIELADFPSVRMGVIYREEPKADEKVRRAFLDEVMKYAARFGS